jgi:uncharacterized pyridoxal phosphate-containing UPF0001 family protein
MWLSVLQNIIISILVIFLSHHLILHLKDTYTIKKTKNFSELQEKKYKSILDEVYLTNETEKNKLIQQIEKTRSDFKEIASIKEEMPVSEEGSKSNLTEIDLKLMNDDLDNFLRESNDIV